MEEAPVVPLVWLRPALLCAFNLSAHLVLRKAEHLDLECYRVNTLSHMATSKTLAATSTRAGNDNRRALKAMTFAASAWFVPVLVGQFIFVAYILHTYGSPLFFGDMTQWNDHLSEAWIAGRTMGNGAVAAHLALAIVVHIGGPLQLIPQVRSRFPRFHRWTGRVFVFAMLVAVVSGAYMMIARDIGEWTLYLGFSTQMIFIIWFAAFTLRHAIRREISDHMRWATRLFLAASAVWFLRILVMVWFVLTGGIGIDQTTGTGWFLDIMSVGQFLPLAGYEIYHRLKSGGTAIARYAMAAFLWFAALATAVGVALATLGMWFPVLG